MFKCPKCSKIYKLNGKWIKKHLIEKCHVMHLKPVELVEKQDINLTILLNRINHIEFMIKNNKITKYHDDPIERIKANEAEKINDPVIRQYRQVFADCITELKKVLEIRKEQVDNNKELNISHLTLIRE